MPNVKESDGVYIQVKSKIGKSQCMTVYGENAQTIFNRIFFLFRQIGESDGTIKVTHYATKKIIK